MDFEWLPLTDQLVILTLESGWHLYTPKKTIAPTVYYVLDPLAEADTEPGHYYTIGQEASIEQASSVAGDEIINNNPCPPGKYKTDPMRHLAKTASLVNTVRKKQPNLA